METFVKIWFAQISRYPKHLSCPKFGGAGGGGVFQPPPAPMARTPMGAITCFFS